jgi:RNA polymerase sigma-70 factor (sigma-E family)
VDDTAARRDFEQFARAHWATLMSIGVAVSGSRTEAEDLVQTALTNAWVRWSRIAPEQALAYLRRSIVNANVSRWRRQRGSEVTVADTPELASGSAAGDPAADAIDARHSLAPLLRALPVRQRAVLVLRYLCDLSDEDIATTLGISSGTVRSQAFRGLASLRDAAATTQGAFR